jgi:hypothetical protein
MGNRFVEVFKGRFKHVSGPSGADEAQGGGAPSDAVVSTEPQDCVAQEAVESDRETLTATPPTIEERVGNDTGQQPASWQLVLPGYEFADGTLRAKGGRNAQETSCEAEPPAAEPQKKKQTGVRRPLIFGLSAGCVIALLGLRLGTADPERLLPSAVEQVASLQVPCTPATIEAGFSMAAITRVLPPWLPAAGAATSVQSDVVSSVEEVAEHPEPAVAAASIQSAEGEPAVAAPAKPKPKTRSKSRIEMETRQVMVSGRAVAAVILLKRTGSKYGRTRVRWKTLPGTATPTRDYEGTTKTVQFADGQVQRTIFVPLLQQPPGAESKTFSVVLERAPQGSPLGSVTSTTVTILGDG